MPDSIHLTDDQLVAALDGELSSTDVALVEDHIAACWTCRTRRDALVTAMTDFVQARDTVLFPRIPAPTAWPGLRPRLAQLQAQPRSARLWWPRVRALIGRRRPPLTHWRTALVGAAIFAIVIVAVQTLYERPLAAAEVLARTQPVERFDGYRQLTIEERDASSGRVLGRRRIEIWQDSTRRVTARRLFAEQGRIIAGEWTRADGSRTVFVPGQPPTIESPEVQISVTPANAWRLSPGAVTFADLSSTRPGALELAEGDDTYTVSAPLAAIADATIVLTVRKADMHPVSHTLRIGTTIVFTVETAFDEGSGSTMPASMFEPDRELLDNPVAEAGDSRARAEVRRPRLTEGEALDLEVDALLRLNRAGALLGEQVRVSRSLQGVTIEARAETIRRRDELRTVLSPLADRPGARVDVQTFADAESDVRTDPPASVTIVEFSSTRGPVYDDLRKHFLARADTASGSHEIDAEIQTLTHTVLGRSLRARMHARAIVQLTSHISPAEVEALDAGKANEWWRAVAEHARRFEEETHALRVDLDPVFYTSTPTEIAVPAPTPDPWTAAQTLLDLAAAHDTDLSHAFARSVQPQEPLAVRSPRFRESLLAAEHLAAGLRVAASSQR